MLWTRSLSIRRVLIGAIATLTVFAVWWAWDSRNTMTIYCPAAPPPHEAFLSRDPLPSCGTFAARLTEDIPHQYRECMTLGRDSSRGAELTVVTHTATGDPITTYYRVLAPRLNGEAFIDHSALRSRDTGWDHIYCRPMELGQPWSCSVPR